MYGTPGTQTALSGHSQGRGAGWRVRAREERQRQGWDAPIVPQGYPLPRTLTKAARQWGTELMTEAFFDPTEQQCSSKCSSFGTVQALSGFCGPWPLTVDKAGVRMNGPSPCCANLTLLLRIPATCSEGAALMPIRRTPDPVPELTRAAYSPPDDRPQLVLHHGSAGVCR